MKRIIFIDIDNTLVTRKNNGMVPQNTINVLKTAQKRGVHIILSTGREFDRAKESWEQIQFNDFARYLVTSNGSLITDMKTNEIIFESDIKKEVLNKVLKHIDERKLGHMISYKKEFYVNSKIKYWYLKPFFSGFEWVDISHRKLLPLPVRKIGVVSGLKKRVQKEYKLIKNKFSNDLEITTSGHGYYIELNSKDVSKATAAKILSEKIGADLKNCAAIGDSMNDFNIMKSVGTSIAMGNSDKELLGIATFTTKKTTQDGVARAVNSLIKTIWK